MKINILKQKELEVLLNSNEKKERMKIGHTDSVAWRGLNVLTDNVATALRTLYMLHAVVYAVN